MNGGEEGSGVFGVSRGDAAPSLKVKKRVFDEMAQFVEVSIIRPLNGSVFLGRNDGIHLLRRRLVEDRVGVITFIGDPMIGTQAFDPAASLRAIRWGTSAL